MLRCGVRLRRAADPAATVEEAARAVCAAVRDEFADPATGAPQCALVRFYKTHPYAALPAHLARFADALLAPGTLPTPGMRCLTLLATAGDEPAWNDRRASRSHQAIPLPSPQLVEQAPMIAGLVRQFGLRPVDLVEPAEATLPQLVGKTYGVFHVEQASGSPYVPAQRDFVARHGIRSVVGFGGTLPDGHLFAVIAFTRVRVSRDSADRFRNVALDVKSALLRFDETRVFAD